MAQEVPDGYFARNIDPSAITISTACRRSSWPCRRLTAAGISTSPISGIAAGACSTSPTRRRRKYCTYIPGPENTWTIQIQVADGKMIAGLERIAPGWGGADGQPFYRRVFYLRCERAGQAETDRPLSNRQHRHPSQFLRRRQSGARRRRRAGTDRKNLSHRRYRAIRAIRAKSAASRCRSRRSGRRYRAA